MLLAAAGPLGLTGWRLVYQRYFRDLYSFLGLRKKRRVWGTVYDSQTKQPLDPAVVELIDADTGEVKERAITDLAGRFGFLATEGRFKLKASKTHYEFPSQKETGPSDEIFGNLYHGETLTMAEGSTLVAPNIPMDPVARDWNQEAKQRLLPSRLRRAYFIQIVFNTLFVVGFGFALYNYFEYGGAWNTFTLSMYFVVMILRFILKPKHLWGRLTKNGQPMVDVKVELLHPKFNVVMGKALSSIDGKFFLKVPEPGDYNLRISTRHGLIVYEGTARVGKERVFNNEVNLT